VKYYKPSEICETMGMTSSQFRNARRAAGIPSKKAMGSAALYSEKEVRQIMNAFNHQHRRRAHSEAKVNELKLMMKESGY
jgi:hypothetical protein